MVTPPPIQLSSLGMADSIILMILALVVFGPRRLPQIGRQIGKLMFEFRKASNDFKFQMEEELRAAEEADRRKREEAERARVAALAGQSQASVSAPAQTVESSADIGAVEPPAATTYPEQYPAETTPEGADVAPRIQPPQTGEQVSASARPDDNFGGSEGMAERGATADINSDADVAANAEEFTAESPSRVCEQPAEPESASAAVPDLSAEAGPGPGTAPRPASGVDLPAGNAPSQPGGQDPAQGTQSKEPVSQHG